ncbi:MAG TPA: protein-disulfide reductase DsbD [Sulfurivirga caldicuralii]|nr:protein-disulfide reductase DsbD [Sulfurivirga caldicuralii]
MMGRLMYLLAGLLLTLSVWADTDPIDVDKAFQFEGVTLENGQPVARWSIAEDYYLYRERFRFAADPGSVTAHYPPAKIKDDPIFGKTPVYEQAVAIPLTLHGASGPVNLTIQYQGCWEGGVCYPPQTRKVTLTLPEKPKTDVATDNNNPLAAISALIAPDAQQTGPLPVDEAFVFTHTQTGDTLTLSWQIQPQYYLYQDKIQLIPSGGLQLGDFQLPKAKIKDDPIFGKTPVYYDRLAFEVPLRGSGTLTVKYQGCWDGGVCYPPVVKTLTIRASGNALQNVPTQAADKRTTSAQQALSETDQIANALKEKGFWFVIGAFFLFGLLLTFTPCVLPMIPILSSIIVGQGPQLTTGKAFLLSSVYVLAMALTYTLAGVLAGLFGANLQVALQNPWVLGAFALVFVALALSMFGFYELQLPASLQTRLNALANKQQGGTLTGVAIMGALSALIVGPCVAPPLAGALIYIGQTGDALLGGSALFAMSLGMGVPLIIAGTLGGKYLPHAGGWMDTVKAIFGVVMLGLALWIAERILPFWLVVTLSAMLLIVSAVYMGALEATTSKSGWAKLWKGLGLVLLIWGVLLLISVARGTPDLLTPLKNPGATTGATPSLKINFKPINSLDDLQAYLGQGQPVLLDFYADWCISCKEMERFTFSDPQVQARMSQFITLKADVTDNRPEHKALMQALGIIGPPAILFFDPQGQEIRSLRVVGTKTADEFAAILRQALATRGSP